LFLQFVLVDMAVGAFRDFTSKNDATVEEAYAGVKGADHQQLNKGILNAFLRLGDLLLLL